MVKLYNAALYLLDTFFLLYIWILILRIILQAVRADPYNPISQLIVQLTRYPLAQLQALIPRWRRFDIAASLYVLFVSWVYIRIRFALMDQPAGPLFGLFPAVEHLAIQVLNVYSGSLFVYVLLSWVGPGMNNPAGSILWSINEPLLRPVRRVLPPYSGLDFSPLIVILLLQLARILLF